MFITIEGPEGSGKTTAALKLHEWLNERNIKNTLTKEPGALISKECQQIRALILDPNNNIAPKAEFFLYLADRAQHVSTLIEPILKSGTHIISDRFIDSTLVYQGVARGLGMDQIKPMIEYASNNITPDLTFILDVDVETGLSRAKQSNTEFVGGDRMELENIEFHNSLRSGFLYLSKTAKRYTVIDASQSTQEVFNDIVAVIEEKLK